ncbi:MAG: carbon storage regulator CsrA [Phycisphaerales bacterium]|nr:carbon storage regulator CsrA [Planctomycetota bacterium]MCH8509019.1 carbon storage regulator CsrA [Phycisphaerales bacterium]
MLVLSRQRDETIMIGDEIEISVVDIRGDKVRLGITAPTRIAVHRKEVYEAIRRENAQASRLGAQDLGSFAQTIRPGPARRASDGQDNPKPQRDRTLSPIAVPAPPATGQPHGKNTA